VPHPLLSLSLSPTPPTPLSLREDDGLTLSLSPRSGSLSLLYLSPPSPILSLSLCHARQSPFAQDGGAAAGHGDVRLRLRRHAPLGRKPRTRRCGLGKGGLRTWRERAEGGAGGGRAPDGGGEAIWAVKQRSDGISGWPGRRFKDGPGMRQRARVGGAANRRKHVQVGVHPQRQPAHRSPTAAAGPSGPAGGARC
jgi:hypothetical protein